MVHTFNPSTQKAEDLCELQASLIYIECQVSQESKQTNKQEEESPRPASMKL